MIKRFFIFILLIGDQVNIMYIKQLISFNHFLNIRLIYEKDIKTYIRNITKGFDILITTRIDYDDQIYYDAVNDVRKSININKPVLIYGYHRGLYYFESEDKYYNNEIQYSDGAYGLFLSLIIDLNRVNDTYTIYDMGNHFFVRKFILNNYKSLGIKELNYEPAIFDSGDQKFIYVRQNYSHSYSAHKSILRTNKYIKYKLNLSLFYGK